MRREECRLGVFGEGTGGQTTQGLLRGRTLRSGPSSWVRLPCPVRVGEGRQVQYQSEPSSTHSRPLRPRTERQRPSPRPRCFLTPPTPLDPPRPSRHTPTPTAGGRPFGGLHGPTPSVRRGGTVLHLSRGPPRFPTSTAMVSVKTGARIPVCSSGLHGEPRLPRGLDTEQGSPLDTRSGGVGPDLS